MLRVTQRIPTEQYAYIEFTDDYEDVGEALAVHNDICSRYADPGLSENDWAKVRNRMFQTGQFDVNIEGLSKAQRYFINQCKLALRANKPEDPVIN